MKNDTGAGAVVNGSMLRAEDHVMLWVTWSYSGQVLAARTIGASATRNPRSPEIAHVSCDGDLGQVTVPS